MGFTGLIILIYATYNTSLNTAKYECKYAFLSIIVNSGNSFESRADVH